MNVKVGAANGAVDVSQVIAGIDWVVQHRGDPGVNIRVLVLAYGTDSVQPADVDPLAYAVEVAWQHGIVVVAAAGNRGTASPLDDPAMNPYVIAVGASEPQGTLSTADDLVSTFSNGGTSSRRADVVAPGRSVVSLRVPGSFVDLNHPEGLEPDGLLRGSGTSQASAVVGGSAALLLQAQPSLTPDQVKAQLKKTAMSLPLADPVTQGAGQLSIKRAIKKNQVSATKAAQSWPLGTGTGSLEAARGRRTSRWTACPSSARSTSSARRGTASRGRVRAGAASRGRAASGTVSPGAVSPGAASRGRVRAGPVSPGAASRGRVRAGAVSPGAVSPGRVSRGPVRPGAVSPGAESAWSGQSWSGMIG